MKKVIIFGLLIGVMLMILGCGYKIVKDTTLQPTKEQYTKPLQTTTQTQEGISKTQAEDIVDRYLTAVGYYDRHAIISTFKKYPDSDRWVVQTAVAIGKDGGSLFFCVDANTGEVISSIEEGTDRDNNWC